MLDKFLTTNDSAISETIRRHRREELVLSFDPNERLQGCHVEIWDETATRLSDGSFASAVTCHERIVRACELADVADLIPDRADLLADLAEKVAVNKYLTLANDEMRAAMEQAQAGWEAEKITVKAQAEHIQVTCESHSRAMALLTENRNSLSTMNSGLRSELDVALAELERLRSLGEEE